MNEIKRLDDKTVLIDSVRYIEYDESIESHRLYPVIVHLISGIEEKKVKIYQHVHGNVATLYYNPESLTEDERKLIKFLE